MNKDELIDALESSHQDFIEMVEELSDEMMMTPGVNADWSIKDILAHLTYWEGQLITLLFQARQGNKPTSVHFGKETVDEVNHRWHANSQDRALEMIWQDFQGIRKQTLRRVNEYSEEELNNPNLFAWLKGVPLWQWIANDTFEHEEEHAAQIGEWLDQRDAKSNGNNQRAV